MHTLDMNQSLEQIEGDYWKDTDYPTGLVQKCFELRKKRLKDLDEADLRTLINQNIGVATLLPIAIAHLKENILAEGDFYPGDLLESVLSRACDFWKAHKDVWTQLRQTVTSRLDDIANSNAINDEIKQDILASFKRFNNCI